MAKLLEVCVDNFESAMAAIAGGANRLELCSALTEGGLTPTPGLLTQVQACNPKKIPVFCMIRCRAGNFVYSPEEMDVMKEDVTVLRRAGTDGFVFGALLENGDVDMKRSREILRICHPLPVTFHRAFDFCRRPTIEIEVVIDLGFKRVLTSGKQKNAQLGVKLIKQLIEQVDNRIIIIPGGGVTKENLKFIVENTGALEYHGSFRKIKEQAAAKDKDAAESEIKLGDADGPLYICDENLVAEVNHILKNH